MTYPAISGWHLEVERRIEPQEHAYQGYTGTDGRPVFLVYCHPPWLSHGGFGAHIPICADDEMDAINQTLPIFRRTMRPPDRGTEP